MDFIIRSMRTLMNTTQSAVTMGGLDQLKEAMILLSPLQRRRLILVYAHKFTLEEVARAEGVSTTAIFHSNTKALNKTRKNYKGG